MIRWAIVYGIGVVLLFRIAYAHHRDNQSLWGPDDYARAVSVLLGLRDRFNGPMIPRYLGPNDRHGVDSLDDVHAWLHAKGFRNFVLRWNGDGTVSVCPIAEPFVEEFTATFGFTERS